MYGDPQHNLHHQQPPLGSGGNFPRGHLPPPPGQMMRQESVSSTNFNPTDYQQQHHQHPGAGAGGPPQSAPFEAYGDGFGGKRIRKLTQRRAVDYTNTIVKYMQNRMWQLSTKDRNTFQPTPAAAIDMLPPVAFSDNASVSFAAKFVHTSLNKNRCSINQVLWTPNGRRLITGSQSGEFTLWNGQSFNFEMILQAHDQAIRSMVWSHNDNWMVSGDDSGSIKYWQSNMNNVKANKSAHKESVRGLSFCRTDLKFCSCSDDTTVKVWDFARCQEERSLSGHGWDVKSVDWHPTKSLLVSGGKDNLVKLWDAKSGRELCSFHGHKNTVLCVKWNQNGNWVLTASKDQIIKLYDIRAMKELESFRGHRKDVTALAWHPFHEEYFVSGSYDGCIFHWLVGHETPQVEIFSAHDSSIWDLSWHPVGYLLCSGSNDHTTKFWCRNRPGDTARDKFNMSQNQGYGEQHSAYGGRFPGNYPVPEPSSTPGPFAPGLARNDGTIPGVGVALPLSVPSFETSQVDLKQPLPHSVPFGSPPLPPGPHSSLLGVNPQQVYQQNLQHVPQQHHGLPQQLSSLPTSNLQILRPPSHLPLLPHLHLPRPTHHGMQHSLPSSIPSLPIPGAMSVQGSMNQVGAPLTQGHFRGAQSGSLQPTNLSPAGSFPTSLSNMSGQSNPPTSQLYEQGTFNHPQGSQIPSLPGYNTFQSGSQSGMPPHS